MCVSFIKIKKQEHITQTNNVERVRMTSNGEGGEVVAKRRRKGIKELVQVALRGGCLAASATAMAVMLTATEEGVADIYGFKLTLSSNWSFSPSYQSVFFFFVFFFLRAL